jgi:magnesium-transporting ATPase (P-type)
VWVLTGDMLETAISIGVACRLLSPAMRALVLRNADFMALQASSIIRSDLV